MCYHSNRFADRPIGRRTKTAPLDFLSIRWSSFFYLLNFAEISRQNGIKEILYCVADTEMQPADKRDTLSLRLSDFIRDLDGYEKALLEKVGRTDFADMTAEQMEQFFSEPATVQQLLDFLKLVQG